jgi:6-phosphogluconate dehydrogenase (decarboxylating)
MKKGRIDLGDMNIKLLKKVEELTLYAVDQQKQIEQLKKEQNARIANLEKALAKLADNK